MELKVIRAKEGIYVPSNPEDIKSVVRLVQKNVLALVPSNYKLDESKYEVVNKVNSKKK